MIRASRTAATTPDEGGRPPGEGGPPRTAAVMLLRAKEPIWALPIGRPAITKNEATAARTPRAAGHGPAPSWSDPAPLGRPLVEAGPHAPEAGAGWRAATVERGRRPTTTSDEGERDRADARAENDTRSGSTDPLVGPQVREMPSRMLSVARVAMIEGIFTPRIRPALTSPSAHPHRRIAPSAEEICGRRRRLRSGTRRPTTPKLIIAPTDRSR
jgi:hypothetical protein